MSYILDALRKSDQQRRRDAPPLALLTRAADPAPIRPGRVLIALVLIGLGVAIGWWRPWQQPPDAPSGLSAAAPPADSIRPPPDAAFPYRDVQVDTTSPRPVAPVAAMPPAAAPGFVPGEALPTASAPSPAATGADPAPGPALRADELPASVRTQMPDLTITAHSHSSISAERMVMINGRMLREGEHLGEGLRLEQITADGVILDYQGHRFRQPR